MKYFATFAPLVVVTILSLLLYFYTTPEAIVNWIGLENAYLLMFSMATLGGLTTFNTVPYYSVIFVLATAGVNPILLGLASACGVMAGDSFFIYQVTMEPGLYRHG